MAGTAMETNQFLLRRAAACDIHCIFNLAAGDVVVNKDE